MVVPPPPPPPSPHTIYVIDFDRGTTHAPFDTVPGDQVAPVWFPGDTLLGFLMRDSTQGYQVFTGRPDGSDLRQRTRLNQAIAPFFDVTPENNLLLAIVQPRPANVYVEPTDIFELTLDGTIVRRLTNTLDPEASVSASPDGTTIAYESGRTVWLMNRDGSNRRRLAPDLTVQVPPEYWPSTRPAESYLPSWSADGKWVLFTWGLDDGDVYSIRLADDLIVRLTREYGYDVHAVLR
jgi:Tol biopolymer transport system component